MSRCALQCLALFTTLCVSGAASAQEKLLIITNPNVQVANLSLRDLHAIFLKQTGQWPNRQVIRPIDWIEGAKPRTVFLHRVLRKSEYELAQYWIGEKFNTGYSRPLRLESAQSICEVVSSLDGAISYILQEDNEGACTKVKVVIEL